MQTFALKITYVDGMILELSTTDARMALLASITLKDPEKAWLQFNMDGSLHVIKKSEIRHAVMSPNPAVAPGG